MSCKYTSAQLTIPTVVKKSSLVLSLIYFCVFILLFVFSDNWVHMSKSIALLVTDSGVIDLLNDDSLDLESKQKLVSVHRSLESLLRYYVRTSEQVCFLLFSFDIVCALLCNYFGLQVYLSVSIDA